MKDGTVPDDDTQYVVQENSMHIFGIDATFKNGPVVWCGDARLPETKNCSTGWKSLNEEKNEHSSIYVRRQAVYRGAES